MMDNDIDMQACEHCGGEVPIESAVSMSDCWFCSKCYAEWKAGFDACEHEWISSQDEHGNPAQYCDKCCGLVNDEDMPLLFPVVQ